MTHDPEFAPPFDKAPALAPRGWWRGVRWLVIYPALLLMGGHFALTGSPIPLWHVETLRDPLAVRAVRADALVLDDGRTVRLPGLRSLPAEHPLWRLALRHGVEVGSNGVVGLIDHRPICGLEGVTSYRVRVNLTDLAAWLHPEGIDPATLPTEEVQLLREHHPPPPPERDRFSPYDLRSLRDYRRAFDHHAARRDRP